MLFIHFRHNSKGYPCKILLTEAARKLFAKKVDLPANSTAWKFTENFLTGKRVSRNCDTVKVTTIPLFSNTGPWTRNNLVRTPVKWIKKSCPATSATLNPTRYQVYNSLYSRLTKVGVKSRNKVSSLAQITVFLLAGPCCSHYGCGLTGLDGYRSY